MNLGAIAKRHLPAPVAVRLKQGLNTVRSYRDRLLSVDKETLRRAVRRVGVRPGDVLFVQSSFDQMRTVRATAPEVIQILCEAVGAGGTVVMPTFPMEGLTRAYLDGSPTFDWRRTPSRSGLLTEIFRRMPGTERSIHPTHPVAARGAAAGQLTADHERSETPFDRHSPFAKMLDSGARILCLGRFDAMTFRHLADHLLQAQIPYPIYDDRVRMVRAFGKHGNELVVQTRAHNADIACDHLDVLRRMARQRTLRSARAGRLRLFLVDAPAYVAAYHRDYALGRIRHYLKTPPAAAAAVTR